MSQNIQYEVHLAVLSIGTGIELMALYDVFRILRMFINHNMFWIGIEDFGYWVYCAWVTFDLLYKQNDGSLRMYAIAGTLLGMLLYQYLVSRRVLKCLKKGQGYLKMRMRRHKQKASQVKR